MRSPTWRRIGVVTSIAGLSGILLSALPSGADGTETLGSPSVAIADGSGIAIGGTGLQTQPGTISVDVPAGATVEQVLLYWEGDNGGGASGDDTIVIEGNEVTGTQIGGPTVFFADVAFAAFRADITGLGLVSAGASSLEVDGLANNFRNNGAGVAVIYDDGTDADLQVRDGLDLAFVNFESPLDTTAPQTYTFASEAGDRTATLSLFAASVEDGRPRPNAIDVTTGGVTTRFTDPFTSNDGAEWDATEISFTVPAGASSVTVQALSVGDGTENLPASFAWIMSGLTVPVSPPETTTTVPETTSTTEDVGPIIPPPPPPTTGVEPPQPTTTVPVKDGTTLPKSEPTTSTSTTRQVNVAGVQQSRPLARTGTETASPLLLALVLIAGGVGVVALAARTRRTT